MHMIVGDADGVWIRSSDPSGYIPPEWLFDIDPNVCILWKGGVEPVKQTDDGGVVGMHQIATMVPVMGNH